MRPTIEYFDQQLCSVVLNAGIRFYECDRGKSFPGDPRVISALLPMSLSNADVERFFSYMKGVKSRYQNIMKNPMLSGILYMLYGLKLQVLSAKTSHSGKRPQQPRRGCCSYLESRVPFHR